MRHNNFVVFQMRPHARDFDLPLFPVPGILRMPGVQDITDIQNTIEETQLDLLGSAVLGEEIDQIQAILAQMQRKYDALGVHPSSIISQPPTCRANTTH